MCCCLQAYRDVRTAWQSTWRATLESRLLASLIIPCGITTRMESPPAARVLVGRPSQSPGTQSSAWALQTLLPRTAFRLALARRVRLKTTTWSTTFTSTRQIAQHAMDRLESWFLPPLVSMFLATRWRAHSLELFPSQTRAP